MAFTTINDPSAYFQVALYTGTGSNQSITNGGNSNLQPEWVWVKDRSATNDHKITDSSRLANSKPSITLESNTANAEYDDADPMSTDSFDSDGFTIGTNGNYNTNTNTYVAWQWKANGGTTTTNDASATSVGTIDSVYQANTTAGFSIVTHTGTGANGTIAHGLGVAPNVILLKCRSNAGSSWMMFHTGLGNNAKTLSLDANDAEVTESSPYYSFNNTAPTSTVFSVGAGNTTNGSSRTFVTYCFAEIKGYSKFGAYTGNGDNDGTFQFTGFQPSWLMIKRTDSSTNGNWWIHDTKRDVFNVGSRTIKADTSAAEVNSSDQYVDLFSNGFKLRNGNNSQNGNTNSYVYMAFAGRPFVTSKGTPNTAGVIKLT